MAGIEMSFCRQDCLALVFILLALACAAALWLLAGGHLRIDSEWPGLIAGAILLLVMWLALKR